VINILINLRIYYLKFLRYYMIFEVRIYNINIVYTFFVLINVLINVLILLTYYCKRNKLKFAFYCGMFRTILIIFSKLIIYDQRWNSSQNTGRVLIESRCMGQRKARLIFLHFFLCHMPMSSIIMWIAHAGLRDPVESEYFNVRTCITSHDTQCFLLQVNLFFLQLLKYRFAVLFASFFRMHPLNFLYIIHISPAQNRQF